MKKTKLSWRCGRLFSRRQNVLPKRGYRRPRRTCKIYQGPVKPIKVSKALVAKKVCDQLQQLHKEVSQTVTEMTKSQKIYADEERVAHEARLKAADAEAKVKHKTTKLFTSFASLQKNCTKLSQRKEVCEHRATVARNDYVLNLGATNAHQRRFYGIDLPQLIKTLDGEMFEKMREFFTLFARTELQCCGLTQECFTRVQMDALLVSQDYNQRSFLHDNSVFTDAVQYHFVPQDNDEIKTVKKPSEDDQLLTKEARKWASKVTKENQAIQQSRHQMELLLAGGMVDSNKPSDPATAGSTSQTTPVDPETRMEELRQTIRRLETGKVKAEARIEALREAGVNVDEWLNKDSLNTLSPEGDGSTNLSSSTVSVKTESSGGQSRPTSNDDRGGSPTGQTSRVPTDSTYINYEEDDYIDETFAPSGDSLEPSDNGYWSGRSYPTRCMSLYDFHASNADELSLKENEYLELVGDGDGDGWVRARSADGKVGYIPENYIQVVDDQSEVVDETEVVVDSDGESSPSQQTKALSPAATGTTGSVGRESGGSTYSATDYEVQETVRAPNGEGEGPWAIAIYDYMATCEDELSFREGQRIRLLSKDENGVDDGFWQGEIDGKGRSVPLARCYRGGQHGRP
ncbi:hypothetical protein NP493_673g01034 [Ridgeia piscesae]|uniref:Uncharacterized protein n=1 Tax=Ridgeia piscesae TaxID=27915 RepID=A0AAD9KS07_RIDPI|nr:hypothetical protein NP493_673g01034 [Ridgeia piscesae]